MKIVVTGALGHIGSRLVRELPGYFPGIEVVMIDNLATQRYSSLFNLPADSKYHFVEGDVTDMDIRPFLSNADAVVHLAALTDATKSFENPEEMESVNFMATRRVAEACAETSVTLIHASSTSIYGPKGEYVDENCDDADINPQSPYALTKLKEEILLGEMYKSGSLKALTFRFGTIYGTSPGMRFHTAVNKFCWQAVMQRPLTIWKTAYDQMRPYLDLGDAVRAISHVLHKKIQDGRVYNVVSDNITVRQVIESIRNNITDVEISFVESPVMNQLSFSVQNTRLAAEGFVPEGNLDRGVQQTIHMLRIANGL